MTKTINTRKTVFVAKQWLCFFLSKILLAKSIKLWIEVLVGWKIFVKYCFSLRSKVAALIFKICWMHLHPGGSVFISPSDLIHVSNLRVNVVLVFHSWKSDFLFFFRGCYRFKNMHDEIQGNVQIQRRRNVCVSDLQEQKKKSVQSHMQLGPHIKVNLVLTNHFITH